MNIIPPVPTPTVFNTGTVNTEAVRRDNSQRETVPALTSLEKSAAESGVGKEADKVKAPGQLAQPLIYEKPTPQTGQQLDNQNNTAQDNGEDPSAGKESAEQKQQEQQQEKQQAEQQQVTELKQRDIEVRAHEHAHASIGGQYAGTPQYEYTRGPDGQQYAVGGEVSIDVSKASTPEETIRKAQQVKAAALAPAQPSAQDLRVATEATQIALEARTQIANEKAEKAGEAFNTLVSNIQETDKNLEQAVNVSQVPDLDEIVDGIDVGVPTRTLANSQTVVEDYAEQTLESPKDDVIPIVDKIDLEMTRRISVIENFYQKIGNPKRAGLNQSA
jgi:hypothetical protein